MSLWSTILYRLKEMMKPMIGSRTIEQTLHVAPVISSQMEHAIELWSSMYKNEAPWLHEPGFEDPTRVVSLGLPSLIASEKARTALIELNSEITAPTETKEVDNPDYTEPGVDDFGNLIPSMEPRTIIEEKTIGPKERAEYLNEQYTRLKRHLRKQIEYGIAKGGLVIKPYVVINKADPKDKEVKSTIEFDFIQADAFYPLAFDASGNITEAAFIQTKTDKDFVYRRLEYHKWQNNKVVIQNKAFKSTSNTNQQGDMSGVDLGQEIPLTAVPEWKDMQQTTTIDHVDKPLFAYFKMPEANTVDPSSPLGVSGFSRAVSLIKDADMQYSRLLWEYEGGEMAIDIDRDALMFLEDRKDRDGRPYNGRSVLGSMQQRLFRKVDLGESDTYQPYAPSLRDSSYIQGLNSILMRIEDTVGISRGTLSDVAAEARTATELKILKQRSYQTNVDIQQAIEEALKDTVYIMDVYCTLYNLVGDITMGPDGKPVEGKKGQYDLSFEWDDSIIVDIDTELGKRITLQQNGLASKLENRMWYFGETERQAREALQKINEENVDDMEQGLMGNQFGFNNKKPNNQNKKPENKDFKKQ